MWLDYLGLIAPCVNKNVYLLLKIGTIFGHCSLAFTAWTIFKTICYLLLILIEALSSLASNPLFTEQICEVSVSENVSMEEITKSLKDLFPRLSLQFSFLARKQGLFLPVSYFCKFIKLSISYVAVTCWEVNCWSIFSTSF